MDSSPGEITRLLVELRGGNPNAEAKLIPLVYDQLHRLAVHYMRHERSDHTLQPTALVNEAYTRLSGQRETNWQNRAHFFGVAARLMRQILLEYARAHVLAFEEHSFAIESHRRRSGERWSGRFRWTKPFNSYRNSPES